MRTVEKHSGLWLVACVIVQILAIFQSCWFNQHSGTTSSQLAGCSQVGSFRQINDVCVLRCSFYSPNDVGGDANGLLVDV